MAMFKLLAGGHIQDDPQTGEERLYKVGEVVPSERDLEAEFGREKFQKLQGSRRLQRQLLTEHWQTQTLEELLEFAAEEEIPVPEGATKEQLIHVFRQAHGV